MASPESARPHLARCAFAALAATVTVVAVGTAVTDTPAPEPQPAAITTWLPDVEADLAERAVALSRAADREQRAERAERERRRSLRVAAAKSETLAIEAGEGMATREKQRPPKPTGAAVRPVAYPVEGNRALGLRLMLEAGFGRDQWPALEALWTRESGWNHLAENPSSGAYGIPQSLPGTKMATAGADWRTNPATQIRWGLGYIRGRYGSPSAALAHSDQVGWY